MHATARVWGISRTCLQAQLQQTKLLREITMHHLEVGEDRGTDQAAPQPVAIFIPT